MGSSKLKMRISAKINRPLESRKLNPQRGVFPSRITFLCEFIDSDRRSFNLDRSLWQEELNRAERLSQNGAVIVEVDPEWRAPDREAWEKEIIDLALLPFETKMQKLQYWISGRAPYSAA